MLERGGGPKLAWQLVRPNGPAKVGVVLLHGYGEYAHRYRNVVETWQERGIATLAFDLRGHNDSGGRRGHIDRWNDYLDDVFAVMDRAERDAEWKDLAPPVLFGHSLGGLIAVHAALQAPARLGALVLSSPFIGMSLEVPALKRALGVVMSRIWPTLSLPTGLEGEQVTRDPEIAAAFDKDPLTVRTATARWYTETRTAQAAAERSAGKLACSLYCVQAGDDVVASADASRRFFDSAASRDKRFELAPGARHEILQDLDRTAWAEKLGSVILSFRPVRRHAKTDGY
jgi:alpha-beta hydrolase superfamily lysophospholipase